MKTSIVWGLLCLSLLFVQHSYAQEPTELTCNQKAEELLKFKHNFKDYPPELIDEMIAYISPCAEDAQGKTSPASAYVKGLLHLQKGGYTYIFGQRTEISYLQISRAAHHKYPPAMFARGVYLLANNVFIKTYSPHTITINKDFEKLLTLNYKTDDVHYVLGYLALKNMIAYHQEFTNTATINKAKTHFEASNHKMAKHWLAIMHYFGYGVPIDRAKGLQMLANNDIFNSRALKQTLQNQNNDWIPIPAEERLASFEQYTHHKRADTILPLLANHFRGHLIEYDWTGAGVKRYIPMSLRIVVKEIHEIYKKALFNFDINGHTSFKDNQRIQEQLGRTVASFGSTANLKYKVKNVLKDHPDIDSLTYDITGLELREGLVNNKPVLVAKGSGKIVEFNETISHPFRMVLYKEAQNQSTARSIATPKVLDKNFATISPNPIGNEFNITYTLDQAAEVQVSVYDFFGQQKISLPKQKNSTGGTQTITIDSAILPSGTYVIQMNIDGMPYSKTVVKL